MGLPFASVQASLVRFHSLCTERCEQNTQLKNTVGETVQVFERRPGTTKARYIAHVKRTPFLSERAAKKRTNLFVSQRFSTTWRWV